MEKNLIPLFCSSSSRSPSSAPVLGEASFTEGSSSPVGEGGDAKPLLGAFLCHGGSPIAGWLISWKIPPKKGMIGGYPHSRKLLVVFQVN